LEFHGFESYHRSRLHFFDNIKDLIFDVCCKESKKVDGKMATQSIIKVDLCWRVVIHARLNTLEEVMVIKEAIV
jgi:hypothetical protein